jgi:hypothetical protein
MIESPIIHHSSTALIYLPLRDQQQPLYISACMEESITVIFKKRGGANSYRNGTVATRLINLTGDYVRTRLIPCVICNQYRE